MGTPRQRIAADLVAQAVAYEHGEGVPKDQLKAAALYCEAARDGDPEAQYSLGWMYANGRGVPRDDAVAASFFALAAAAGHAGAEKALSSSETNAGLCRIACIAPTRRWVDVEPGQDDGPDPFADLPAGNRRLRDRWPGSRRVTPSTRGSRWRSSRRIELRAERAVGTQCPRADATDPGNRGPIQRRECLRRRRQSCAAVLPTCAGCSPTTRATSCSRQRPTTPAKRRSTGTRAFRPIRKRGNTCGGCCACIAARPGIPMIPAIVKPASFLPPSGYKPL